MIKVTNEVNICELNGKEAPLAKRETLVVKSHWNMDRLVVLQIGDSEITVNASDLMAAIGNATHVNRF